MYCAISPNITITNAKKNKFQIEKSWKWKIPSTKLCYFLFQTEILTTPATLTLSTICFTDGSETKNGLKVALAVLGPILALCLVAFGIFLYYRRSRRNHSTTIRRSKRLIESGMDPSMLAFSSATSTAGGTNSYSHELRATAAGDSTLKVRENNHYSTCAKFEDEYYDSK